MSKRQDNKREDRSWTRLSGIGIEFAAAVGGLALLGYWIDRRFESSPWGLLICTAVGLIGGTYNLIRSSMSAFKKLQDDSGRRRGGKDQDDAD